MCGKAAIACCWRGRERGSAYLVFRGRESDKESPSTRSLVHSTTLLTKRTVTVCGLVLWPSEESRCGLSKQDHPVSQCLLGIGSPTVTTPQWIHKNTHMLTYQNANVVQNKNTHLHTYTHRINILLERTDTVDASETQFINASVSQELDTLKCFEHATQQNQSGKKTSNPRILFSVTSPGTLPKDTKADKRIDCLGNYSCNTLPQRETGCSMHQWCAVKQMG